MLSTFAPTSVTITLRRHGFQDKHEEAGLLFERCQAIEENALGPHHPSLAITLSSLAGWWQDKVRTARRFQNLVFGCAVNVGGEQTGGVTGQPGGP